MSTEAKNPNGHAPLRPVPLCHRLLAAPAGVDRSCVGSACSMWAFTETGAQAGPSGFCSEVRIAGGYMPPWLDSAQDAPEPAEPEDPDCKTLFWANDGAYGWVLQDKSGVIYYSGGPPDQLERRSCKDGYDVAPWPGGPAASVEPQTEPVPAPVGTWGGHTDWITWGGGECPIPIGVTCVGVAFRDGGHCGMHPDALRWKHTQAGGDIIAYRIVQPEPASKPAPDADLGPVPSPCWRRDSQGPVDDQAPQEKPKGLVRALGQSELRLAAALRELETTRIALAEAEAELERLGSTRAYEARWDFLP